MFVNTPTTQDLFLMWGNNIYFILYHDYSLHNCYFWGLHMVHIYYSHHHHLYVLKSISYRIDNDIPYTSSLHLHCIFHKKAVHHLWKGKYHLLQKLLLLLTIKNKFSVSLLIYGYIWVWNLIYGYGITVQRLEQFMNR